MPCRHEHPEGYTRPPLRRVGHGRVGWAELTAALDRARPLPRPGIVHAQATPQPAGLGMLRSPMLKGQPHAARRAASPRRCRRRRRRLVAEAQAQDRVRGGSRDEAAGVALEVVAGGAGGHER